MLSDFHRTSAEVRCIANSCAHALSSHGLRSSRANNTLGLPGGKVESLEQQMESHHIMSQNIIPALPPDAAEMCCIRSELPEDFIRAAHSLVPHQKWHSWAVRLPSLKKWEALQQLLVCLQSIASKLTAPRKKNRICCFSIRLIPLPHCLCQCTRTSSNVTHPPPHHQSNSLPGLYSSVS